MTPEQYQSWLEEPETVFIIRALRKRREDLRDRLIDIALGTSIERNALESTKIAGVIVGMNTFLELDYEDLIGDVNA